MNTGVQTRVGKSCLSQTSDPKVDHPNSFDRLLIISLLYRIMWNIWSL